MSEQEMREMLAEILMSCDEAHDGQIERVKPFNEAGLMTRNEGLVIRMEDGSEYQLTIVQSR